MKELSDEELINEMILFRDSMLLRGKDGKEFYERKEKILSRLSEGRKAVEETKTLEESALRWAKIAGQHQAQIEKLAEEIERLKAEIRSWQGSRDGVLQTLTENQCQIENLKCCGNCKYLEGNNCLLNKIDGCSIWLANKYCSDWKPDGLSRKERE